MTGSRIGFLALLFKKNRVDWRKSKSVFARELQALMEGTAEIAPEHLTPVRSLKGAPVPYEVQFGMANASDCADWLNDNAQPEAEETEDTCVQCGATLTPADREYDGGLKDVCTACN